MKIHLHEDEGANSLPPLFLLYMCVTIDDNHEVPLTVVFYYMTLPELIAAGCCNGQLPIFFWKGTAHSCQISWLFAVITKKEAYVFRGNIFLWFSGCCGQTDRQTLLSSFPGNIWLAAVWDRGRLVLFQMNKAIRGSGVGPIMYVVRKGTVAPWPSTCLACRNMTSLNWSPCCRGKRAGCRPCVSSSEASSLLLFAIVYEKASSNA